MLSALDIDASDEETAALFRYLDADGSGGVSFEQFEPWYSEAADAAKQSAEVFQGIIMSRRTVDSFDKTEVDQAVIRRAIECAIAAPVSTTSNSFLAVCPTIVSIAIFIQHFTAAWYNFISHASHSFTVFVRIADVPSLGASYSSVLRLLQRHLS